MRSPGRRYAGFLRPLRMNRRHFVASLTKCRKTNIVSLPGARAAQPAGVPVAIRSPAFRSCTSSELGQRGGRAVDHLAAVGVLARLSVHRRAACAAPASAPIPRRQQHQSRPDRAEAAIALALVELALRQLDVARRQVVDDRDARQPWREVIRAHLRAGRQIPAQHQAEFDLVVEQLHVPRAGDRRIGRGDARRRLREDRVERKVLDAAGRTPRRGCGS